jgi:hypothetical protein
MASYFGESAPGFSGHPTVLDALEPRPSGIEHLDDLEQVQERAGQMVDPGVRTRK